MREAYELGAGNSDGRAKFRRELERALIREAASLAEDHNVRIREIRVMEGRQKGASS